MTRDNRFWYIAGGGVLDLDKLDPRVLFIFNPFTGYKLSYPVPT